MSLAAQRLLHAARAIPLLVRDVHASRRDADDRPGPERDPPGGHRTAL